MPAAPAAPPPLAHQRGWLHFAAIMILIAGALNVVWGILAVTDADYFKAHAEFLTGSLHTWGWVFVALGALELLAALSIWRNHVFGRVFGIAVATIGVVVSLLSLSDRPAWGIATGAIHMFVIYALTVYGGRGLQAEVAGLSRDDD